MSLSDESAANATNGKHPPTPFNIDGEPITYDGNPAHVEGILYELSEWTARTGHYVTLLENIPRTGAESSLHGSSKVPKRSTDTPKTTPSWLEWFRALGHTPLLTQVRQLLRT